MSLEKTAVLVRLAPVVCMLLFGSVLRAGEPAGVEPVPLPDYGRLQVHPVLMDSDGKVGIWQGEEQKVFIFSDVADIRQGPLRLVAERAVVWVEKDAGRVIDISIYAEGRGIPGEKADRPVIKKMEDSRTQASAMHLRLRSLQGIAWECPGYEIQDIDAVRLHAYADEVIGRGGREESYSLERLPQIDIAPADPPASPIDTFRADEGKMYMREEEKKLIGVYKGNVYGSYGNVEISADEAVLWIDTDTREYSIYASGNVMLRRGEGARDVLGREGLDVLRADRIYVNPALERGLIHAPEMRMSDAERGETYVVRGEKAHVLDNETLLIRKAGTTNCPHGIPHYEFRAGRLQLLQQQSRLFAAGWDVSLVAGERQRTLFWLPYLGMNLDDQTYLLRSASGGRSSGFGTTLKTEWAPGDLGLKPDWIDKWHASVDYYSRRGTGLGTDMKYSFGAPAGLKQRGSLKGYYIHDRADEDGLGRAVPKSDRGLFRLQHRVDWAPGWRSDIEYAHLSDHSFMREYFESDFYSDKAPETRVFNRYSADHVWGGLQIKHRSNDFMTQKEALPGIELHSLGMPLGPFSYDVLFDAGLYEYKLGDETDRADPPQITRLHTDHTISLPFSAGFVKFDPYLRALGTYASKGAERNDNDFRGSRARTGGAAGVRAAADFSRIYNVRKEDIDLNRLRHIITPYVEAEKMDVSKGSDEFIQMRGVDPWPLYGRGPRERDGWIDAVDDREMVRPGLRQRLQTRRDGRIIDWMTLDVSAVFRSEDSVAAKDDDHYLEADFDWKLTRKMSLYSEDNRFSLEDGFDVFNLGMRWRPLPAFRTSAQYSHIKDRSSQISARADMKLSDRYSLALTERYEFNSGGTGRSQNLATEVTLSRWFHKWLMQVEVYYDGRGDGDRGMFVRFSPSFLHAGI